MENKSNSIGEDIDRKNMVLNTVYTIGMAVFVVVAIGLLVAMVAK